MVNILGVHYLLELKDCDPQRLDDVQSVKRIFLEAARRSGATIIDMTFRKFSPQGISGVVIIAESHFSIHTWPEYRYAAVDIFTCGDIDALSAVGYMIEQFKAQNPSFVLLKRGLLSTQFEDLQYRIGRPPLHEKENPNEISSWYFLDFINPNSANLIKAHRILFSAKSKFQEIEILETEAFGKVLMLDGRIQSAQLDEFIYHEALVHPAMTLHPDPQDVLIIGGGEGATLREVLKHPTVHHAIMVDIDQEVVEACRLFMPEWSQGAFNDPRAEIRIDDARKYLQQTDRTFDIIIMDITEPIEFSPSAPLVTYEMFDLLNSHLKEGGIIVNQSGSTGVGELYLFSSIYKTISAIFSRVSPYSIQITSFSMPWGLILASHEYSWDSLSPEEIDERLAFRRIKNLRFYDGKVHHAIFTLPKFIRDALEHEGHVTHDSDPPLYRAYDYALIIDDRYSPPKS